MRIKNTKKQKNVKEKKIIFENYIGCLFNDKIISKSQQRFKSDHHEVYTEEVNKIALSDNDDKRLQIFNRITTHPHRTNAFKVRESEMMIMRNFIAENYADCLFYDEIILES